MSLLSNLWDLLTGRLHTRISEEAWRTEELAEQARIAQRQVDRLEKLMVTIQAYGVGGTWKPVSSPPPLDMPVAAVWTSKEVDGTYRTEFGIARCHAVGSSEQFHYNGQHWQNLNPDGSWSLAGPPKMWTDAPMYLLKDLVCLPE
jgi:hypothetical protein